MTYVLGALAGANAIIAIISWVSGSYGQPDGKRNAVICGCIAVVGTVLALL